MDKKEFDAWAALTKLSEKKWIVDTISLYNQGAFLAYKGGVSGQFIKICPAEEGKVKLSVGEYTGAIPHINEAIYLTKHSSVVQMSVEEGVTYLSKRLGIPFLVDIYEEAKIQIEAMKRRFGNDK